MEKPSRTKIAVLVAAAALTLGGFLYVWSPKTWMSKTWIDETSSPQASLPESSAPPPSQEIASSAPAPSPALETSGPQPSAEANSGEGAAAPVSAMSEAQTAKPEPVQGEPVQGGLGLGTPATPAGSSPTPSVADAPMPPRRPEGLAGASPVDVPLPPHRPIDLATAAPPATVAPPAPAPGPQSPPQQARPSAAQQLAAHTEPALRPAPEEEIDRPDNAPSRFTIGAPAYVRIFKKESELELWLKVNGRYALYHTYPICRWSGRLGPKIREADYQSPEGFYSVSAKQLHPQSKYHLAFNVGYPNAFDRQNGRTGGMVMVHGGCKSVGCFAMTDRGVDEIYRIVAAALTAGQREVPVHIFPFRMTEQAVARETNEGLMAFLATGNENTRWTNFWRNLKEGYDLFHQTGEPPIAFACGDHYAFGAGGASCSRIAGW